LIITTGKNDIGAGLGQSVCNFEAQPSARTGDNR
jgi:hypothetical protein